MHKKVMNLSDFTLHQFIFTLRVFSTIRITNIISHLYPTNILYLICNTDICTTTLSFIVRFVLSMIAVCFYGWQAAIIT